MIKTLSPVGKGHRRGRLGATDDGHPRGDPSEARPVRFLTVEDVLELHSTELESFGGGAGIRSLPRRCCVCSRGRSQRGSARSAFLSNHQTPELLGEPAGEVEAAAAEASAGERRAMIGTLPWRQGSA